MKIVFPLTTEFSELKRFGPDLGNPGVGGTHYSTVRLAMEFAGKYGDARVEVLCSGNIRLERATDNLSILALPLAQLSANLDDRPADDIIVVSQQEREKIIAAGGGFRHPQVICWLRHPLISTKDAAGIKCQCFVSVGEYQFFSQRLGDRRHWHIPNIFLGPPTHAVSSREKDPDRLELVNLGALVPAKGFHEIAQMWPAIRSKFDGARLTVIGSSGTYAGGSVTDQSRHIPASSDYAATLSKFIPEADMETGRVRFLGNLGDEKWSVLRNSDVALLNPTGNTEAFPASPLECMSCGVPVIASGSLGMYDSMRFFPELQIRSPSEIPTTLKALTDDAPLRREIEARSKLTAMYFVLRKDEILCRWRRLFERIIDGSLTSNEGPQLQPSEAVRAEISKFQRNQDSKLMRRLSRLFD